MLKIYFEEDTTRYAEEFCDSYLVTMDVTDGAILNVKLTLKENVYVPPRLVITGGSAAQLGSALNRTSLDFCVTYAVIISYPSK